MKGKLLKFHDPGSTILRRLQGGESCVVSDNDFNVFHCIKKIALALAACIRKSNLAAPLVLTLYFAMS